MKATPNKTSFFKPTEEDKTLQKYQLVKTLDGVVNNTLAEIEQMAFNHDLDSKEAWILHLVYFKRGIEKVANELKQEVNTIAKTFNYKTHTVEKALESGLKAAEKDCPALGAVASALTTQGFMAEGKTAARTTQASHSANEVPSATPTATA